MSCMIVTGSHRTPSQSLKVAEFTQKRLQASGQEAEVLDLATLKLPQWEESIWSPSEGDIWSKTWNPVRDRLGQATSVVLVAPEWAGMVPPILKNFLLLAASGGQTLAHKPCMLIGVSAGEGGSYPIAELRTSGYKNTRLLIVPDHMVIRKVETVFNGDKAESESDQRLRDRLDYSLKTLSAYAQALTPLRQRDDLFDYKTFPFGM